MRKNFYKVLFVIMMFFSNFIPYMVIADEKTNNSVEYVGKETISKVTFDQSMGMNGFIDDEFEVLEAGGVVREYHNYRWVTEKFGEVRFTQGTWWDFDNYYKTLYEAGVTVMPCIQGTSKADVTNYNPNKQQKPVNPGEDSTNPLSYSEHASTMFQYAARYGSVKVSEDKLLLEPGQKVLSGLGYIKYYENWNEPDKTWEGEESHFSPAELAAMASADYDGHEGRLGDTYGIKQADPDAKLVLGGVAGNGNYINYLNEMLEWSKENRTDKQLPFDALNFHIYVGKNSPENSNFIEVIDNIVAWRDEYAPDKEIWITEFGYDTNPASPHGVNQTTQKNYLLRTYLLSYAHGIDRSTMYMSRDASSNKNDTGKYATSGLTTLTKRERKESWYGVSGLKKALNGYTLDKIVKESDDLYIYKFKNGNMDCYVIWSPNGNVNTYNMNIDGNNAKLETLVTNSTENKISDITSDNVTLNVSETPIFVKMERKEEEKYVPMSFNISLKSDVEFVRVDDDIELTLNIKDLVLNSDDGSLNINGNLEYDNNIFKLLDINGLDNFALTYSDNNLNGIGNVTNDGTLLKLRFRTFSNTSGNYAIKFKDIKINNKEYDDLVAYITIVHSDNEEVVEEIIPDIPEEEEPTIPDIKPPYTNASLDNSVKVISPFILFVFGCLLLFRLFYYIRYRK